jgi:hypothetical protein
MLFYDYEMLYTRFVILAALYIRILGAISFSSIFKEITFYIDRR